MRLSCESGGSVEQRTDGGRSPRKKRKRLDAICEEEYNRNHPGEGDGGGDDGGVRRSSRVRRAPVLLDVSPSPSPTKKKPRRLGKNGALRGVKDDGEGESGERVTEGSGIAEDGRGWGARLRSRGKSVGFKGKKERESRRGKRKLFEDGVGRRVDEEVEVEGREVGKEEGMPKIVKSKRPGRIKATKRDEGRKDEENEVYENLDETKSQEVELTLNKDEENASVLEERQLSVGDQIEILNGKAPSAVANQESDISGNVETGECNGSIELSPVELVDKQADQLETANDGKNASEVVEDAGVPIENTENEVSGDKEVHIDANIVRLNESKQDTNDKPRHQRIKEGRRCGLCGGGTDGKPPKKLVHDNGESENEAYSGSSASEEHSYDIWDGFGDEPGWLGRLLGPVDDRNGIARIWVHQHCAVWSPEV